MPLTRKYLLDVQVYMDLQDYASLVRERGAAASPLHAPTEQVTATVWDKVVDVHDLCGVAVMINLPDDHGTAGGGQVADPRRRAAISPACY